jgi:hypothetical protein
MPYKKMKGLGQVSKKELEVLKKSKPKVARKPKTNKGLGQISAQEMNMIRKYRMNMNKKPK